ncbi:hypothetical protein [Aurantiacibacter rhizosphaerae]|uniref:ATPase n=1 Tax=Aurantiacibacter rhizosphaerae TaxID=2691582 RepID=A0A844XEF4_9SPHN|nr:hypothetical protein [Aurantiacibacter rhizosphaerae]MWV28396.1 hypothetical protein [Aurantiacibacter rhizosphaerae]
MSFARLAIPATLVAIGYSGSAAAEVVTSTSGGFATHDEAVVSADRDEVWQELVHPESWWSHSWSDDSNNLQLDAVAGGCFCENLPGEGDWPAGSVEHMRVIMVMPGKALRMSGSLGPLQAEGLAGTLTVTLADTDTGEGTRISWDYVTGGQSRIPAAQLAPAVDAVQSEFLGGLVARLGGDIRQTVDSE